MAAQVSSVPEPAPHVVFALGIAGASVHAARRIPDTGIQRSMSRPGSNPTGAGRTVVILAPANGSNHRGTLNVLPSIVGGRLARGP